MELLTMGKVLVAAKIENLEDLYETSKGVLPAERVRSVNVTDALVDLRATMLSLPRRFIEALGLKRHRSRSARTTAGTVTFGVFDAVRLTVQERDCVIEVAEVPDECPVLIGQVPLELLDFVIDPAGRRLIGNPEHGGEHMMDLF